MRVTVVPPLRYLGLDAKGDAIVGLPQLHVRVECGGCGRYLGPSEWRHHAASVCRRCESRGGAASPVHDQANQEATPPITTSDSPPFNTASQGSENGPFTRARSPRAPAVYRPCTHREPEKSAKYDLEGASGRRRSRSKESNRSDRRRPTTAVIRPCNRRATAVQTEPTRARQSRTDRALKDRTVLGSEQDHDHGEEAENQENERNEPR